MGQVGTAALGIGTSVANMAGNAIFGQIAQNQQLRGQKKALEQQNEANYDYWLKTNYSAQKGQMKEAGLNPGLLYGMGSGGGGQSGGANAMPQAHGNMGMDIAGNAQLALMKAQEEKLKAEARNLNVGADKAEGVDTLKGYTEIESLKQGIQNSKAQQALTEVSTRIAKLDEIYKGDTLETRIGIAAEEFQKIAQEVRIVQNQADISNATKETVIKTVGVDYLAKVLGLEATRQGIVESKARVSLMSEQGKGILANIVQGYLDLEERGKGRNVNEVKNALEADMFQLEKMTGIPKALLNGVIGGSILKSLLTPVEPGRTVIEGFNKK